MRATLAPVLLLIHYGGSMELPGFIKPCHIKDPKLKECVLKEARRVIPEISKGSREYGFPSFNPLKVERININQIESLNASFTDLVFERFHTIDIKSINFDFAKKKFEMSAYFEKIKVIGNYSIFGKLLLFELKGDGKAILELRQVNTTIMIPFGFVKVKGEEYLDISSKNWKIDYNVNDLYVYYYNIFKDNEELTKSVNKAFNNEWRTFFDEFKPIMVEITKSFLYSILENLAKKIPFKSIFPD